MTHQIKSKAELETEMDSLRQEWLALNGTVATHQAAIKAARDRKQEIFDKRRGLRDSFAAALVADREVKKKAREQAREAKKQEREQKRKEAKEAKEAKAKAAKEAKASKAVKAVKAEKHVKKAKVAEQVQK